MQIQKRDIALSIVLTVITCGIYGLYWMYKLTNEIHALSGKPRTVDGGTAVLYTILTCSLYFYYWLYKIGGELVELRRENGLPPDSVSNKTYTIVTIIMTIIYIVFTMLEYTFQFILSAAAEAAPMHHDSTEDAMAIGIVILAFIIGLLVTAIVQAILSGIVLWAVYKRKDDSPTLVYLLMAILRTYNFTMAFLQASLNDFLQQKNCGAPPEPIFSPDAPRVSLQKPHA